MNYLYNVATKKGVLVTVRIREEVRDEFAIAAELRGASMSGLIHQFIVRTIREEKDLSPQSFNRQHKLEPAQITKAPHIGRANREEAPKKRKIA